MASWFSPVDVNFAGEPLEQGAEDSVSSSSVSSTETEDAATSSGKSSCPPVQLLPLDELGVVGACRRGRRKGQRNRTPAQRVMEAEVKRTEKNVRERMRVEHVRDEYLKLQVLLGYGHSKSVNKLQTLNAAIGYIKKLRKLLNSDLQGDEDGKLSHLPTLPIAQPEDRTAQEKQQETLQTLQSSRDKRTENSFLLELETDAQEANYLLDFQLADLPDGNNFDDVCFEGDQHSMHLSDIAGPSFSAHSSLGHISLTQPSPIAMLPADGAVTLASHLPRSLATPLPDYAVFFDASALGKNTAYAFQTPLRH